MCRSHRTIWAMVSFGCPANAKTIIRARCATPCWQVLEPAIFCSAANCRSVTITFAAFPSMVGSPSACKIETLGDCRNPPHFMEYQFCRGVLEVSRGSTIQRSDQVVGGSDSTFG